MEVFKSRAINLFGVFIWVALLIGLVFCLYGWFLYLIGTAPSSDVLYPLLALSLLVGSLFIYGSLATFPTIEIDRDSIVVKYAFTRFFFSFDDVQIKHGGRVLRLGGWTVGGWYIPFRREECVNALEKAAGLYPPKAPRKVSPTFLLYLLALPILTLTQQFLKSMNILLNPMAWSLIWGITAVFSLTMFMYNAPVEMKIGKLDKAGSSILFGISVGIIIFLFMLLATS